MTPYDSSDEVTALLAAARSGDASARERLLSVVYDELHRLASGYMRQERLDHTLQPTALVNEAYLRLVGPGGEGSAFVNRGHFIATAAVAMRRILINHARAKEAQKRGGGRVSMELDHIAAVFETRAIDLLALDEALSRLAQLDLQQARLVELRFFGGMSFEECAEHIGVSQRTVHYECAHARAWLMSQLASG
jgi:RNA polymerase sigma factor (TIGR02999 family)